MQPAPDLTPSPTSSSTPDPIQPRPRRYTAGLSDGFGDRLLMFDNGTSSSLEVLRFKKALTTSPEFESALRQRMDEMSRLRHASVAPVRAIEHLANGDGLALVSNHLAGRRLSEMLHDARGAAFALELVRQLTPALAAVQQLGSHLAHGALTPERIVVTREGRLIIVEHVMGAAVESLNYSAGRLRTDFGLPIREGQDPIKLDGRADIIQLGFIALALLLGRKLDPADYPSKIPARLDEIADATAGSTTDVARLRRWVERALQVGEHPFTSATEANDALNELADELEETIDHARSNVVRHAPAAGTAPPALRIVNGPAEEKSMESKAPAAKGKPESVAAPTKVAPAPSGARQRLAWGKWALAAVGVVAVGQAAIIGGLMYTRSTNGGDAVVVASPMAPVVTAVAPAVPELRPEASTPPPAAPAPTPVKPEPTPAERAAAATGKFGGIRVTSAVELQVFEGGKLIGSTAGPIAISEGPHSVDVVNEALGFRYSQNVDVKPGQLTAVAIAVPNGKVSINAVPWADVTIDGTAAGETPLANLSLSIGSHEVVFKHPQLGEQKQTVVVKAGGLTRVNVTMQQAGGGGL